MKPHHRLLTRRDFLSQGFLGFNAVTTLPTLLGSKALASQCLDSAESGWAPFMVFDMAGGAALPANFLVGKKGGPEDLLASYSTLGWNPREAGALNSDFGLPLSAKYSKILQGILDNSSPEARQKLRMGSFCHSAQDDTSSNRLNCASMVLKAGVRGVLIANGLGLRDSLSGGNSAAVFSELMFKPTRVTGVNDVLGATRFGGPGFAQDPVGDLKTLAELSEALMKTQSSLWASLPGGISLTELAECAFGKSAKLLQSSAGLDPRADAVAQAVYQINANSSQNDSAVLSASLAVNTIKGLSGPSTYTLGGCDYHDGTQTTGDAKDLEMGVHMGRAIETAHRLGKPFVFSLITDGGTDASPGTRSWRGDSGTRCMTVMGCYHPKAAPKMIRTQVGAYTDGQGADATSVIGADPSLVAYALAANYLQLHGKLSEFKNLAPGVFVDPNKLKSVLLFEPFENEV